MLAGVNLGREPVVLAGQFSPGSFCLLHCLVPRSQSTVCAVHSSPGIFAVKDQTALRDCSCVCPYVGEHVARMHNMVVFKCDHVQMPCKMPMCERA